jgi:glycine/D-amino acid oxidase-like deaminating enzyme
MTHVAVVGAGIIGAATTDQLCRAGARVTLIEAGQPGGGASGTSLAWLNSGNKHPREYHDLSVQGIDAWRRLAGEWGDPPWYVPTGSIAWSGTDDGRTDLADRLTWLRDWGYPATELTSAHVAELEPGLRLPADAHAAYFPAEGFLHGGPAVQALVDRAGSTGAVTLACSPVTAVASDGTSVTGLELADGRTITADSYVFCAGAATPVLLAGLGVAVALVPGDAPQSPAPCLVGHVATGTNLIHRVVQSPEVSLRPLQAPGLYLEAGDVNETVDVGTRQDACDRHVAELLGRAAAVLPALDVRSPATGHICVRPLPVDGKPIVGRLPDPDNAYLIVTHSGMTLGALLGRLAAAELLGTPQAVLEPYRPTRFPVRERTDH